MNPRRLSLLWKIWLSTSVALTALFAVLGYWIQRSVEDAATRSLQREAQASAQTFQGLWRARADWLRSLAGLLGSMPTTVKALQQGQPDAGATVLNMWERAGAEVVGESFLVLTTAGGAVISWLPAAERFALDVRSIVERVGPRFPRQSLGFLVHRSILYELVATPLYAPQPSRELAGVLLAGFAVHHNMAEQLKRDTGNSDFVFASRGLIYASSLDDRATGNVVRHLSRQGLDAPVSDGYREYIPFSQDLLDPTGKPVGQVYVLRSFEEARQSVADLRRRIAYFWIGAIVLGLLLTYVAVERIVQPLQDLDRAASEVAMQNYDYRVTADSDDELGRLASTFNKMCESIQAARAELIRRERISTIGRMASSIVHDLRNPLAAIYGGSEMLVDTEPTPGQTRRISENIYRASRRIQDLLDDLVRVTRGPSQPGEPVPVLDVVRAAREALEAAAQSQGVRIRLFLDAALQVAADRTRLEGVFVNLIQNALDVMPDGGEVRISASTEGAWVMVEVADTGPGIAPDVRAQLFQPFVSFGKRNGLGLGLALARQTVLDHGGDLWASSDEGRGARFYLRLPRPKTTG